ncbi:hypothetical protein [Magnetospirillum sp. LM-5]|uniref:hypothetical protein n=1 Tax=Magnetospirillum sp. LM-5 TaxID=2681466 RepID=UPI00156DE74D|nr:hypothetical protein [Magnetospirillum sp. LM-5]
MAEVLHLMPMTMGRRPFISVQDAGRDADMRKSLMIGALALSFGAATALPALASPITITNVGITHFEKITLTGGALGGATWNGVYSGQIELMTPGGELGVWCVDLFHDIYLGHQYSGTVVALTTDNRDSPAVLTTDQKSRIAAIAAFGNAVLDLRDPKSFDAVTLAAFTADLDRFKADHPADYSMLDTYSSAASAAVQAAIWEVEYRLTATSADANFGAALAVIKAQASNYFGNIGGHALAIADPAHPNVRVQTQWVSQVPEPSSLLVFVAALVGLAIRYALRAKAI